MLRFGSETGPVVVVAMPLFEEANRMRAFAATLCRLLAERGVASVLPDLPGRGESVIQTADVTLAGVRAGLNIVVDKLSDRGRRVYTVAFRSGVLFDADAPSLGRWRFAPVWGAETLRDLARVLDATGRNHDARHVRNALQADEIAFPLEIAGNLVSLPFLQELATDRGNDVLHRRGVPLRTVRLDGDRASADRHVPGTPLWRRAEPGHDPTLAALLADDIADWIAACES